ncbi:Mannosyltransferase 1 CMT1 [Penicillium cf. griseofulvum]|uniref:Mannosyltransferase 1 CMT1 n=1 Tax=Penicillium cf. griseofulvum TaxID=2972120 RepID=A0A9W9M3T9_9EURO|nr:Mannosyltransferase 1 CMT1 [Penicillium cf. griseofulvum]KAJ5434376.1 Mannosyltransferase 1 CMT1 [Penicillium cf. griseofulvum]
MPASVESEEYELDSESLLGRRKHDRHGSERRHHTFALHWTKKKLTGLLIRVFLILAQVLGVLFGLRTRRRACFFVHVTVSGLLLLICLTAVFWPSYTHLPPHYQTLRNRVQRSEFQGRGNIENQKVFIAAVLYDPQGKIASGQWGQALLKLIEIIGEQNVFLSIYENNSGQEGETALHALADQVTCDKSIVSEPGLSLGELSRVTIPGGETRIRRIDYLAEVRNRALQPLQNGNTTYDKLLYLNDVIFDPVEALQLLFCTNADANGVAQYRATCAVDFSNPFKFYDTYATRDLQGYGIGLPFYPWFTTAGRGQSRQDVLDGRDAVRVRSCWGGMTAFDARFFQGLNPIRFRADSELFWDASECCIVHADIQSEALVSNESKDSGSYINPFVRVAYNEKSYSWLWMTRRFERLYPLIHNILNHVLGFPRDNPRRTEVLGQKVIDAVWVQGDGEGQQGEVRTTERESGNDGFCGRRGLEVLVEERIPGQDGFEHIRIPAGLV